MIAEWIFTHNNTSNSSTGWGPTARGKVMPARDLESTEVPKYGSRGTDWGSKKCMHITAKSGVYPEICRWVFCRII